MPPSRAVGARVWLSRLAPYFIAALALTWVFHTTDLAKLRDALRSANIPLFVGVSALILVANCAADTFAMHRVFGWFGCHIPYRDLFIVRASTYLLAVVNYHVGQAAIVGYLYRAKKVPLLQATGWILFIIGVNVGTLFLLASVGVLRSTGGLPILKVIPALCIGGAIAWAVLLAARPRVLVERRVLAPLFEMGITGHVRGVLVRLPHVGVLCLWHIISLHLFHVQVPVLDALLYLPIFFAAASLPLNVNGLGVAQLVAIAFFSKYYVSPVATTASLSELGRAAVAAYSLSTAVVSLFLQLGLGVLCVGRATKLGVSTEAPEQIEVEAAHAIAHEGEEHPG